MKILTGLVARLLFAIPMIVFGLFHFMNAEFLAGIAPFGGVVVIYLTGVALIAAGISLIIQKQTSLAMLLLGIFLLLTAFLVHVPALMGGDEMAMSSVLKDLALAGGAFYISGIYKDLENA